MSEPSRVLYVITCATPGRPRRRQAGRAGAGTLCVIATPSALRFIDQAALEEQTGFPVRHQYKKPGTPDLLPRPTP